ncbi:MAG: YicC/YloC family endoribonuclease [Deltaproteobacteria bacterium]
MKSMTGFGKSEIELSIGKITVEARSENHRFLDMSVTTPDALGSMEGEISDAAKYVILRGKVRISVTAENHRAKRAAVNIELARESLKSLERLRSELGIASGIGLEHLLSVREFFLAETKAAISEEDLSKIKMAVLGAVGRLDETRALEGAKLESDLAARVENLAELAERIKSKRETSLREIGERAKERIMKLLEDREIDQNRLYQELAIIAERSDITEELVRAGAHTARFREILGKSGSIGKELDFLVQELNREATTIAAKSKDAEISHLTIEFRSELEKMKEQIQNIE